MRLLELAESSLAFPAAAEDVKSHRNSSFQGSQQFSKGFFVVVVGASQPGCVVDNRRWRVALGGWARGLGPQIFHAVHLCGRRIFAPRADIFGVACGVNVGLVPDVAFLGGHPGEGIVCAFGAQSWNTYAFVGRASCAAL